MSYIDFDYKKRKYIHKFGCHHLHSLQDMGAVIPWCSQYKDFAHNGDCELCQFCFDNPGIFYRILDDDDPRVIDIINKSNNLTSCNYYAVIELEDSLFEFCTTFNCRIDTDSCDSCASCPFRNFGGARYEG